MNISLSYTSRYLHVLYGLVSICFYIMFVHWDSLCVSISIMKQIIISHYFIWDASIILTDGVSFLYNYWVHILLYHLVQLCTNSDHHPYLVSRKKEKNCTCESYIKHSWKKFTSTTEVKEEKKDTPPPQNWKEINILRLKVPIMFRYTMSSLNVPIVYSRNPLK